MLQNAKDGLPFFVDGIPEYGIKSSDPDFYEKVDASSNNLKFFLNRITVTGLKTCKAVSVKWVLFSFIFLNNSLQNNTNKNIFWKCKI